MYSRSFHPDQMETQLGRAKCNRFYQPHCVSLWSVLLGVGLILQISNCLSAQSTRVQVRDFALKDSLGATHSLADWKESDFVVLCFLGTECPLAKLYAPRIVELYTRYAPRGVQFVGINSNQQDTLREIAHYANVHGMEFPVLKDAGHKVADMVGAVRTPSVFVLDRQRQVRYQGRIDDQFGVGYSRSQASSHELASAIDQLLADKDVAIPVTHAVGCFIGRVQDKPPTGDITYCNQVARILQKHCVRCHREGQIAPFSLMAYDDVAAWSETMLEVIAEGRMPPWHANPAVGHFANDAHMPDADKQTLARWVKNGMPKGDPGDLPTPQQFSTDWRIPQPDVVLKMPQPFRVPAKGVVPYQYFEVDAPLAEDVWIKGSEIRPGNRAVVHHVFVFFLPPGQEEIRAEDPLFNAVAGFAPGMPSGLWPDGLARLIPAGSKLVFQVHYTPVGREQFDQTEVGLVLANPPEVKKEAKFGISVNMDFRIPPGKPDVRVNSGYQFTQDTMIHALIPHMHYRGKSFRFVANYPDGKKEILLDVPNYDFNWQNVYELANAKLLPERTVLMCEGIFDNSPDNLANPDPTKEVTWGDQSWDEMMLGSFVMSLPDWIKPGEYPKVQHIKDRQFKAVFRFRPNNKDASKVSIAGTFNGWNGETDFLQGPDDDGYYHGTLLLEKGHYEYKFVVDGSRWTHDPENPDRTGPFTNSVLHVPPKGISP